MRSDRILTKIKHIIDTTNRILITGQGNPDGDSIGSQLALYDILNQQKQRNGVSPNAIDIVISNDALPPALYSFLPTIQIVTPCERIQTRQFEVGFILDSGKDRVGKVLPVLEKCKYTINIDHHRNRAKGDETVSWVDPEVGSVAEMIYAFFEHPDWKVTLNTDIATCLYAGMIYDTGSFRYPSTSPYTLRIAAKLIETGIDFAKIAEQLFLEKPFSAIQLLSGVLQSLQRDTRGEIIWGTITQELLKTANAKLEQDEGIITQYAFTEGTKVAVLFKELSADQVKVSFRSRGAINVGKFAQKMSPEGGGHDRAAGCTLHITMDKAQELVIRALQDELQQ